MKPGYRLLLAVGALLLVYSFGSGLIRIGRLYMIRQDRAEKLETLQQEEESLEIEIERLTSDSLYIEEIARKEYGLIREGEEVYHLTLPNETEEGD